MALSISCSLGTEVSVSDPERTHWPGSASLPDDVQSAVGVRGSGVECADGSCAFVGESAAEVIDIGTHGCPERTHRDQAIHCISADAEKALLGQSFLGERLLCRYGRTRQRDDQEIRQVPRERRSASTAVAIETELAGLLRRSARVPPSGGRKAKPRSTNVVHLLFFTGRFGWFHCQAKMLFSINRCSIKLARKCTYELDNEMAGQASRKKAETTNFANED